MAVGKSGIKLDESKINCYVNDIQIVADGKGISYNVQSVVSALGDDEVRLRVNLNVGKGSGQAGLRSYRRVCRVQLGIHNIVLNKRLFQ